MDLEVPGLNPGWGEFFSLNEEMNQMENKYKKNNNNNSSNSLVFGRRQKCFKVHPLRRFAVVGPEVILADPGRVVIW